MNHKHYRRMLEDSFQDQNLDKAIHSPSKYIPLNRLKQIKRDNFVSETGKEFSEEEVNQSINERSQAYAEKIARRANKEKPRTDAGSSPENFPFLNLKKSTPKFTYKHTHDPNIDQHRIVAHDQEGKPVGGFIFEKGPNGYMATSSQVLKTHQRQGVASGAYAHFENLTGNKLTPHIGRGGEDKRSDDAKAMWNSPNRKFGKSDNLSGLKKGKKVYHGTYHQFDKFKVPKNAKDLNYGPGLYFSGKKETASDFADVPVYHPDHSDAWRQYYYSKKYKQHEKIKEPENKKYVSRGEVSNIAGYAPRVIRADIDVRKQFNPFNIDHARLVSKVAGYPDDFKDFKNHNKKDPHETNFYEMMVEHSLGWNPNKNHSDFYGPRANFSARSKKLNQAIQAAGFDSIYDPEKDYHVVFDAKKIKQIPFGKSDKIPGGLADKLTNKDFPKIKIDQGRKVELEHTSSKQIAEEIARDHLTEDPKYYEKLKTIEKNDQDNKHPWKMPSTKQINEDVDDWPNFFSKMSEEFNLPEFSNEDIHALIANHGKVITIPHDQIHTTFRSSHPLSRKNVLEDREGYKPSSDSITQALKDGTPLPMPISFKFPSGGQAVLSGRHRLGHAAENKKDLQVLSVPYGIHPSIQPKKVSKMEKGARGDWKSEGYSLKFSDIKDYDGILHQVTAHDKDGNAVAHAQFIPQQSVDLKSNTLVPYRVEVDEQHRRKGLASGMYSAAESNWKKKIERNNLQDESGKKFWSQPNRPFGKTLEKGLTPEQLASEGYKFKILNPTKAGRGFAVRAYHGKKAVGHLVFSDRPSNPVRADEHQKGFHSVTNGNISEEHQGKGLYQHMIKLAGAHAKSLGSKGVYTSGSQRSSAATRAWDKVATFASRNPYVVDSRPTTKENSDYYLAASEDMKKMSRPRITFPNLKDVNNRPDQEVQLIETGRQKDLFGRKAGLKAVRDHLKNRPNSLRNPQAAVDDQSKRISNKFDRSNLGLNVPLKDGSFSGALTGKARSKFEDGGEAHAQKISALKDKRQKDLQDWESQLKDWASKTDTLPKGSNAYWEHIANRPERPKKPRTPAKARIATKDLSPEQMKARGQAVDTTIEHEALHATLHQIHQKYGQEAYFKVRDKLLSAHSPETLKDVASFISEARGYKRSSPNFNEEVLTHSRDLLTEPKKRGHFKRFIEEKYKENGPAVFDQHIKNLKTGHQKAYETAQSLMPEDIQSQVPVKMAASETLAKAPVVSEEYSDVNWPHHPLSEGKHVKTLTHKDSGTKVHVVHLLDRDEDSEHHTGSIYYTTHNNDPNGRPTAKVQVQHLNTETGDDYDPHFSYALTEPEHRNKGLNTTLHLAALKDYKRIKSDHRLSPGSQKTYEKLSNHPNVKAKLYPTDRNMQVDGLTAFPQDTQHELKWKAPKKLAASEPLQKAPLEYKPNKETLQVKPEDASKKDGHVPLHSKELPNGLTYAQSYDQRRGLFVHQLFHKDHQHPVAELETGTDNGNEKHTMNTQDHRVVWAGVHPDHKGNDYGKQLYRAALVHGKGVGRLTSDKGVSRHAQKAWEDLKNQPGFQVVLGDYKTKAQARKNPEAADMAYEDVHVAQVPNKGKIDEKALFPVRGKLAASESMKKAPMTNDIDPDDEDWKFAHSLNHFKVLGGNNPHKTAQRPDGTYYHKVFGKANTAHIISLDKNGELPVAHLIVDHKTGGPQISESVVDIDYRGKGLGKALYLNALKHHKELESDSFVSPEANKLYHGLARNPNVSAKLDYSGDGTHKLKFNSQKKLAASEGLIKNESADKETDQIKKRKNTLEAKRPHKFSPAKWTHPNGHPRCKICGDEERTGGMCEGSK